MPKNILVIGYGAIGRRHAEILASMDSISTVSVLSRQNDVPFHTITKLEETESVDPDYIVVASNTSLHYEQLLFLEEHLVGKTVLVEKPLFNQYHDYSIQNNSVFVGYNLRFHPVVNIIRERIAGRKLWNIHVFCGSYLPDWRSGRDYRETSSAKTGAGGGVLLDLSHELDYVQWLCGKIEPDHVYNRKVSDLEVETEDLLLLSGRTEHGAHVHISLNYFTRKPIRQIIIDGEDISIQADLIDKQITVHEDGKIFHHAWPELEKNATYTTQHRAILSGNAGNVCAYEEGLETMRLIETIKTWRD